MRQRNNVLPHHARPDCAGQNNVVSVQFRTPLRGIRVTVVIGAFTLTMVDEKLIP
jgi:hypothetical protein